MSGEVDIETKCASGNVLVVCLRQCLCMCLNLFYSDVTIPVQCVSWVAFPPLLLYPPSIPCSLL